MGNLCNGKQSHSKDSLSIKSNESFYYGNSKHDNSTGIDSKVISNSSIVCNTIDKDVIAKVVAEDKLSSLVTKNVTYTKFEPVVLDTLNLFPDSIKAILTGHCYLESTPKKIVLFVLTSDPNEFSDEKCILNATIFSKLKTYANKEFFELFLVDLYQDSGKQNRKLLDLNQWEFKRQTKSAYIIPIIFFNCLLDSEFLLPKILHPEDVDSLMSSIDKDAGSSLFDTLYEKQSTVFKLREIFNTNDLEALSKLIINSSDDKIIEKFLKIRFNEELQTVLQKNYELHKWVFWITRSSFVTTAYEDDNVISNELKRRVSSIQTQLKNTVVERNVLKIPFLKNSNDKNEFINNSCKILTNLIDNIIDQYKNSTMIRSFYGLETNSIETINESLKFIKPLTKFSLPRNDIFEKINKYLTSDSNDPLILNGASGSGKTTLIAQIVEHCQNHIPNTILIVRFAQISKSASIECILHSILNQCSVLLYGKPMPPLTHTLMVFKDIFEKYLEDFQKLKTSLFIFLDGVDQLSDIKQSTFLENWLPEKLPAPNIKIVVTLKENISEKFKNYLEVPVLSQDKIALWSSDNESLLDLSEQIIRLVKEFESKNGKERTEILFNYFIAYGQFGSTESEMFDLLLAENLFDQNWSIVQEFYLEFIQFFDLFLNWFQVNGYYLVAIKSDLHLSVLRTYYQNYKHLYQQIYNYYNDKKAHDLSLNNEWFKYRKHEMLSILFGYINNKSYTESKYVSDLEQIFEKLKTVNCCKVLDDFKRIEFEQNHSLIQKNFRKFLEKYAFQLNYDSWQFYGCLNDFDAEWDTKIENLIKNPPITSLILLQENEDSDNTLSGAFDRIFRLKNSEDFVIGICSSKNEVCVWDIERCKPVRILRGIKNPTNVLDIDQFKCVILSNRELKIFDLNEGKLLSKLKGVMNQKMPFYGLHDGKHVVALSRNRMYVNLMSIETGDCLTTFKAGEDRFLNSLLVSGNGQILVCGDETQKPFPLLVWNLKSRKLLYDLRIAHHDFVTRLSAITYDGNFMCCVCHEINEPNPNFIVVYDLQSGTLFKKWKPNYNTVSIEISSQSCCVLSGLDNAQIYIWDLTTGNCRWKLCGHTAPVTDLRLDPHGVLCLSRNVSAHDLSIRIWDLKTGQLLAVYTPKCSIIDCEITTGYVLMIVENSNKPITLKLTGRNYKSQSSIVQSYGLEEHNGKIFDIVD